MLFRSMCLRMIEEQIRFSRSTSNSFYGKVNHITEKRGMTSYRDNDDL